MNYIRRKLTQIDKPEKLVSDYRGTLIEPGLRVVFNKSGDVVVGRIKEIKKNEWKPPNYNNARFWILHFELHIENEGGSISKIKNPNGYVII